MTGADEQRRTNDRDELARRVAERLDVKIVAGQGWSAGRSWIPAQIRDALLSAEQQVKLDRIDKEYALRRIRDKEPFLFYSIAREKYW